MRPRADERHVAGEHVEKLGNLVDVPAPQPAPGLGQARISGRGLANDGAVIKRAHAAKLDDAKWLLVEAVAPLREEDRSGAVELDEYGYEDEQRRRQDQDRRGEH